ncbi:MAG: hypothetical protein ABR915_17535 [Thermoguttaceae bacterium]|jgi:hypothetical protein
MGSLKQQVIVGTDGLIVIRVPELKAGSRAEVIVVGQEGGTGGQGPRPDLPSLIGSCRGMFRSPEEADELLRRERDAWDS